MPSYAPVPASFSSLSTRQQTLFLYRHILKEGAHFFDERASLWVKSSAQEAFRKNKSQKDEHRIAKIHSDARKASPRQRSSPFPFQSSRSAALRSLERANQLDLKAVMRLLRLSHGMQGRERQKILQPFVHSARTDTMSPRRLSSAIWKSSSNASAPSTATATTTDTLRTQSQSESESSSSPSPPRSAKELTTVLQLEQPIKPKPLHFNNPKTVPPIYVPVVVSLIQSSSGKSVEPNLPVPLFKPLHGRREANLRWRYFTKQVGKLKAPLPGDIRKEMERKSRLGLKDNGALGLESDTRGANSQRRGDSVSDQAEWEQRIIQTVRAWNKRGEAQKEKRWETGRFHPSIGGKPAKSGTLTLRFYRRIWQRLLNDVPILDIQVATLAQESSDKESEQKSNRKESAHETNRKGRGLTKPSTPSLSTLRPMFTVSTSPQAYLARTTSSLKLQAVVNDFDRIGMNKEDPPLENAGRNKQERRRS
ncbi:hypothetical protein KVV02_005291 [Mortierella alpina]|uniref:LYR motif-containing protein Cup1-like N-terminal domain-containing protein n=1 Tax=Mortierella alpina TaxID=64518 RepID=A0A9P7ZY08_MORAP|nr:hypothetical protein KVV02_005291 [Mortierella alpina]